MQVSFGGLGRAALLWAGGGRSQRPSAKDLMQLRRSLLPVQLSSGWELEQRIRVGALERDSVHEVRRHNAGPLTGEQAQQRRSLCPKAAADFNADDDGSSGAPA